jgi:putative membrane protein
MTVPVDARTLLTGWQPSNLAVVPLVGSAIGYVYGVDRLRRRGRAWPVARSAAFGSGLAVLAVALCSGLARYDTEVFSVHMVQHLLLAMVGPALLALGAPMTLALQAASRPRQRRLLAMLRSAPIAVLTHPLVVWVLFGGSLIALYFTPLYAATLRHPWLHDLVHVHLVLVGVLFIWPVVGLDPVRWRLPFGARLLYVVVALPFHSIVGLALISSRTPMWSAHTLADQQAGGGVMLLGGDLITLAVVVIVFFQWARAEERAGARADAMADAVAATSG